MRQLLIDRIDDDISFFMPRIDISMSLDDLIKRIASVYDRSQFPYLAEVLEEDQIFNLHDHAAGQRKSGQIDS